MGSLQTLFCRSGDPIEGHAFQEQGRGQNFVSPHGEITRDPDEAKLAGGGEVDEVARVGAVEPLEFGSYLLSIAGLLFVLLGCRREQFVFQASSFEDRVPFDLVKLDLHKGF